MELQASIAETTIYINLLELAAGALSKSYDEEGKTNVCNMVDHRRLRHATAT